MDITPISPTLMNSSGLSIRRTGAIEYDSPARRREVLGGKCARKGVLRLPAAFF